MNRHVKGTLYGAAASISYGTNPLFALPLYAAGIGVNSVLFYRYFLAVIIYFIWIKLIKRISLSISFKQLVILFVLGLFFSLSSLTLFESFNYIEAGIACTLLFIYPLLVAVIMAVFFKEKITKKIIISIILTSIGIALLYKGKTNIDLNLYGVLMVFASALSYAMYIVGVKNIPSVKHIKSEKLSFYVMLFGLSVYVFNLKFCTQLQILDKPILWLYAFAIAILPTIISLETITIAIKLIGATSTALLGALEPLTAVCIGVFVFHEELTLRIIFGIILILTGVLLIILKRKRVTQ